MRFERPPGATEILLVRHGESRAATADNPFPLVDGHGDPELHANGREQAQRVGERLKDQPISAVYVSNLRRTHETAAPLCAHIGLEPRVDPDLREVFLGEWEGGLMRIKAHEGDPIMDRVRAERRWDVIPGSDFEDIICYRAKDQVTVRIGRSAMRSAPGRWTSCTAAPESTPGSCNSSMRSEQWNRSCPW